MTLKLEDILPHGFYSTEAVDKLVYARDASDYEGTCTAVAWPTTKQQLMNMIKFAKKEAGRFTIRGAGMNKVGSSVPANALVIDMTKLNKVIEWGHDSITVEAGMTLSECTQIVQKKGYYFPVKPLGHAACTIGGMIASNVLGLETYYGRMGEWVYELEIIDGKGDRQKITGEELRNFIGLEGITGVIYAAKLKLLSAPIEKSITVFKFNTLTALMDKVMVLDKNKSVMAIEFFDEFCSSLLGLEPALHLVVEYKEDVGVIKDKEEIKKLNELKEKISMLLTNKKYTEQEDPKIPYDQMSRLLNWLGKNGIPCYGHIKQQILCPAFKDDSRLIQDLYQIVPKLNGEIIGQQAVGIKRKKFLSQDKIKRYMRAKEKYDPEKLLNPSILI
ncbi:FAD-binding oxidoreductase [Candidatus Woesearchaeota archaeon]|nr:FAD-binding oxidoreductase [Candidatus Woesearchaeota archaeon]